MIVKCITDIYWDGEDYAPPKFLALAGDILLVKNKLSAGRLDVHHEDVTDGSSFIIFKNEYVIMEE